MVDCLSKTKRKDTMEKMLVDTYVFVAVGSLL